MPKNRDSSGAVTPYIVRIRLGGLTDLGVGDWRRSRAAYLGHFAANDPFEPPASVDALEADLREAGRPVSFHRYPGTGHWFFEPDRSDAFNPAAAQLAWDRTLAFLRGSAQP